MTFAPPSPFKKLRKAYKGANLALIAVSLVALIGVMGVGIYTGLQAYLRNEIQKAASTAAMAGASQYYIGGPGGAAQPGVATTEAQNVFNNIYSNTPALRSFDAQITNVQSNNGRVSIQIKGKMPTPFLTFAGINDIEVTGESVAQNLVYPPTLSTGMVMMTPPGRPDEFLNLEFPLVDIPGPDIHTTGAGGPANGYLVKACNDDTCYDLMGAETSGNVRTLFNGTRACFGACTFDLARAGVKKANRLRFVDDGVWGTRASSGATYVNNVPPVTVVGHVYLYGYAGSCVSMTRCAIPNGFSPHF